MNNIKKTGFEWCFEQNISLMNLNQWEFSKEYSFNANSYYKEKIDFETFEQRIQNCEIWGNTTPKKTEMFLEYRMYGLVPYNMSPIQQGIQFGHAVVEYGQTVREIPNFQTIFDKWAKEDKTFIILNGGTTNNNPDRLGTLNMHMETMESNGIHLVPFYEPDLGDQLTAFVFLVDERVFNKKLYPNYVGPYQQDGVTPMENEYEEWVKKLGGKKNVFLREYLSALKLA